MSLEFVFLEAMINAIPEGVVVLDRQNSIVFLNKMAEQILGKPVSDLKGKSLSDIGWDFMKPTGEKYNVRKFSVLRPSAFWKCQEEKVIGFVDEKKILKWLKIRASVFEETGGPYVVITFSDITADFEHCEKVKVREERLKLTLKNNGLGAWDMYPPENRIHITEGWSDIFKSGQQEINMTFSDYSDLIYPDDRERVLRYWTKYLSGEIDHYEQEYRVWCNCFGWRWIMSRGKIVKYDKEGKPVKVTGIYKDISGRKRREINIGITEQKFFNAFHYSAIGMAIVSPEGFWIDVNGALLKLFGYSKEELLKFTFQEITHADDLEADLRFVKAMLAKEIATYSMEKRFICKNGDIVWTLLTVSLVCDGSGEPQFFLSQIVDISFHKGLITELENKNQLLNHTTINLKNKISQMEEFSRIVAHNLRSPVANILTLSEMLQSEPDNAEAWGNMLSESAKSLDEVLHDLISIVQIRLNKDVPFESCEISQMIGRIKTMFNNDILHLNISITEELRVPVIHYPRPYMDSILYNLISNAIKYRNQKVNCQIVVRTFHEAGHTVLEVEDNGLGIDLERFGRHLFKLHKTFHKGFDSKGVGLFITKTQVETLGGRISVESEPGVGTVFRVDLMS